MSQTIISKTTPTLSQRLTVFGHALLFVLGFTVVFVVGWGGAITLVGEAFGRYKLALAQIGGAIIILFGLSTLGLFKLPWMYYDTRPQWGQGSRSGWLASALMGIFFAAGWTPCVGTTLGAILTLGLSQQTVGTAMVLSGVYALGLGLPFLVIGLGMDRAAQFVRRFRKHLHTIEIITGIFLILIGLMMLTNNLNLISIWAQRNGLYLDFAFGDSSVPSYPVALLAGLLSFLSPCVLPLVPAYVGYLSGHAFGGAKESKTV
jgi:cytochrome c-type biogenesis protein